MYNEMMRFFPIKIVLILMPFHAYALTNSCEKTPPIPRWAQQELIQNAKDAGHLAVKTDGVQRNTFPAKINGQDLTLHYTKYGASKLPSRGTIISLCGGPGGACDYGARPENLPTDYNVVVIDYLGIGANKKYNSPELMAIDSQGEAIAQLVRYTHPSNLIIYGLSFGTTVATVAAAKLTSGQPGQDSLLKGVLLEGVVGKGDYKKYDASFVRAAQTAWSLLSGSEKKQFEAKYKSITSQLNPTEKDAFDKLLAESVIEGSKSSADYLRSISVKQDIALLKRQLKDQIVSDLSVTSGNGLQQLRAAGCQIFSVSQDKTDQNIFGGMVKLATPEPQGLCDCKTVAKIWDPAEYQIKGVPVLYVNGKQDPNTAIEWAQTHFDEQVAASDKAMVGTEYGGHGETYRAPLNSCHEFFFDSLVRQDLSQLKAKLALIDKSGCQNIDPSQLQNSILRKGSK